MKRLLLALLLTACASLASDPTPPLWVISAKNENFDEARVYVNNIRVATLPGMMYGSVGIPVTRSMLRGDGCLVVYVKLWPSEKAVHSDVACPVRGSRLSLSIEESYGRFPLHAWLVDYVR